MPQNGEECAKLYLKLEDWCVELEDVVSWRGCFCFCFLGPIAHTVGSLAANKRDWSKCQADMKVWAVCVKEFHAAGPTKGAGGGK